MNEIDTMKLVIKHEYEETQKDKWNKISYTEYLENELAKTRVKLPDVSNRSELLITAFTEADRTGYIELLTNATTIVDKVISGNL